MSDKCPFCDAPQNHTLGKVTVFRCGTKGPYPSLTEPEPLYETGVVCDKDCFRNALLELTEKHAKLVEAARFALRNPRLTIDWMERVRAALEAEVKD